MIDEEKQQCFLFCRVTEIFRERIAILPGDILHSLILATQVAKYSSITSSIKHASGRRVFHSALKVKG